MRGRMILWTAAGGFTLALALGGAVASAQVATTPTVPMELPVEVEIELAPAQSLKTVPLWKELIQLLRDPYSPAVRRPAFRQAGDPRGQTLLPLEVWPLDYNFLTAQPLRLRTNDGEVSWDQPGPLYDPAEDVGANEANFNAPQALRTPIGHVVACPNAPPYQAVVVPESVCSAAPAGGLVVYNDTGSDLIPPTGTVVAVAAIANGVLQEIAGTSTTVTEDVVELEIPVNEEDFLRPSTDVAGISPPLQPYVGRLGAEVLGKALFWDMQVGRDGVQSCGSCHFHAGADNRTRNQLNPNHIGGDLTFQVRQPNEDVVASDFPFHKLLDPTKAGEGDPANSVLRDANDVMSSMGVSRFKLFVDIPPIGTGAGQSFGPAVNGVRPLVPDLGTVAEDIITAADGFRRVEPRNTPTMHSAAFNFDNFWDGRARFHFNGGSVFGPSDPEPHIFINPGLAPNGNGEFTGATMGHLRPDLLEEDPDVAAQPVRIKFSSLASQAVGPPLSDFEMSFAGRNWQKIGKKLLQGNAGNIENIGNGAPQQALSNRANAVVPLANQLVALDDSRLGPFSNQGGSVCTALGRPVAVGKPGLCIAYPDLIRLAYARQYWNRNNRHLDGAPGADPFDGFVLTVATGAANQNDRDQFTQMEANFSAFFGLAVQMYEQLLIPDDTPFDRFMDANPGASNGIGQPGEQAVLFPTLIRQLVTGSTTGNVNLVPGFGEDELFGFDIFAGGNLAAALPVGSARNPGGVGSNPFTRNARCMLCHLGPEQTDHTINISHGLLKGDAEFEFPGLSSFPGLPDGPSTGIAFTGPGGNTGGAAVPPPSIIIPSPEPPGPARVVGGLILADEIEGSAQDQVEVEPRGFALLDDPATPWDDRIVAQPRFFAFGDQGVYNVGLRPNDEDTGRGGDDPFGMPLSLSALALMNIGQPGFQPCDTPGDSCVMTNVDGTDLGATFEETGDGLPFPGTNGLYGLQSINPGFEKDPANPQLPPFLAPWAPGLPAGELHPQIDEMAFAPNTVTAPTGGPALEFGEAMFGADTHCGVYDPATFGNGPPNFGWGATDPITGALVAGLCPNNQSGVAGNWNDTLHGTWPVPNRVLRQGAFKASQLRNVELTGPYFHTGSYLTLGQVVDFYLRGGDFPVTNAETRDPNILDVDDQSFGFGRTATGPDHGGAADTLYQPVSFGTLLGNGDTHVGSFADAFPDTVYRYDPMPDANHPLTREPATTTRKEASSAIVKLLLAMTDERVKFEKAPFDRPELFVPIDGLAPQNDFGVGLVSPLTPGTLNALASCSAATPCTLPGKDAVLGTPDDVIATSPVFRRIPAVGAAGNATPLQAFLGVTSIPPGQPGYNCVASAGAVSHFCSNIDP